MKHRIMNDWQKKQMLTFGGLLLGFQLVFFLFVTLLKTSNIRSYLMVAPVSFLIGGALLFLTVRLQGDAVLPFLFAVLLSLGTALQGSLSNLAPVKTIIIYLIGLMAMTFVAWADEYYKRKILRRYANKILFGLCCLHFGLLLFLLFFGKEFNNTRAWIRLPGFYFQATELLKLIFPCLICCLFGADQRKDRTKLLLGTLIMGATALLMLVIGELGTLLVLGIVYLIVLFLTIRGTKLAIAYIIGILFCVLILACVLYILHLLLAGSSSSLAIAIERPIRRWNLFLHPEIDPSDNVQMIEAQRAVLVGGLLGSRSNNYIINQGTDMIFPYLILRLGILSGFVVLTAYLLFFFRTQRALRNEPDPYTYLLCTTLSTTLMIQTLVISFGSLNFIPLTGIPLPLLSEGGASMIVNFALFGLLFKHSCSRQALKHCRQTLKRVRQHPRPEKKQPVPQETEPQQRTVFVPQKRTKTDTPDQEPAQTPPAEPQSTSSSETD